MTEISLDGMAMMCWGRGGNDNVGYNVSGENVSDDDAEDEYNVGGLLLPACHCLLPKTRAMRRVDLLGRKTYKVSQKSDFLKLLEPCS